jgi:UDP-glucuronate 4-epimerase
MDRPAQPNSNWNSGSPDPATSYAPYRLYNIGNSSPVELMRCIELLEQYLGRTAEKNYLPLQPGDVPETHADVGDLIAEVGYQPSTSMEEGIGKFVDWYQEYYGNATRA